MENYSCPRCGDKAKRDGIQLLKKDDGFVFTSPLVPLQELQCRNCDMFFYVYKKGEKIE